MQLRPQLRLRTSRSFRVAVAYRTNHADSRDTASPGIRAEADLIWGATVERPVGHDGVVLLDVAGDELLDGRKRIERMQVQPCVLQASPPGLDHRVRVRHPQTGDSFKALGETPVL